MLVPWRSHNGHHMMAVTWRRSHDGGHMTAVTWRRSHDGGHMTAVTWRRSHDGGHLTAVTWRRSHDGGHMTAVTWRRSHDGGHMMAVHNNRHRFVSFRFHCICLGLLGFTHLNPQRSFASNYSMYSWLHHQSCHALMLVTLKYSSMLLVS